MRQRRCRLVPHCSLLPSSSSSSVPALSSPSCATHGRHPPATPWADDTHLTHALAPLALALAPSGEGGVALRLRWSTATPGRSVVQVSSVARELLVPLPKRVHPSAPTEACLRNRVYHSTSTDACLPEVCLVQRAHQACLPARYHMILWPPAAASLSPQAQAQAQPPTATGGGLRPRPV